MWSTSRPPRSAGFPPGSKKIVTSKGHRGKLSGKWLAYKALLIAPNLSSSQRRVGAALIDHMHGLHGRCDPGMRRLVWDTGYTLGTVQSAIVALCDPSNPDGLFDNVNAGPGRRPSYQARWRSIEAIVDEFEARTRSRTVQRQPNSAGTPTVREHLNSHCSESDPPTVRELPNKTNVRTNTGARPAAPQAAAPCRAPVSSEAKSAFGNTRQPDRALAVRASAPSFPPVGDPHLEPPVAALIQAACAEAEKGSVANPKPTRLDRPLITAEQRRENEAFERLDAGLRNGGIEFYLSAMDRLDADLRDMAVAAEIAEPGAGAATVRLAILTPITERKD
ncbi:hypothetical protein SAMN04515648_0988 [Phyllobacterium sp. CL33Tsu]|uniref:hypothetical protein n=1 Tax=Phyllobacterium sp. CL33Tsu TaxID=1798191 RepID=UPI0008F3AC5D|nr:hypothetical protein [Phyllobacterium sp. CL33Tsu]SFI65178.1 hypothetical protein SAMN04515648_0988 [Phyllobacterium sp. CL33Tsu]